MLTCSTANFPRESTPFCSSCLFPRSHFPRKRGLEAPSTAQMDLALVFCLCLCLTIPSGTARPTSKSTQHPSPDVSELGSLRPKPRRYHVDLLLRCFMPMSVCHVLFRQHVSTHSPFVLLYISGVVHVRFRPFSHVTCSIIAGQHIAISDQNRCKSLEPRTRQIFLAKTIAVHRPSIPLQFYNRRGWTSAVLAARGEHPSHPSGCRRRGCRNTGQNGRG